MFGGISFSSSCSIAAYDGCHTCARDKSGYEAVWPVFGWKTLFLVSIVRTLIAVNEVRRSFSLMPCVNAFGIIKTAGLGKNNSILSLEKSIALLRSRLGWSLCRSCRDSEGWLCE